MAALGLLAIIGGGLYVITYDPLAGIFKQPSTIDPNLIKSRDHIERDLREAGMTYGSQKTSHLAITNLNDAFEPKGPPAQDPNMTLSEFYRYESVRSAFAETFVHPFFFSQEGMIPLTNASQSNPNIERATNSSVSQLGGLTVNPRVLVEDFDKVFSEKQHQTFRAGEPTESSVLHVPPEGRWWRSANPYGSGGAFQNLYSSQQKRATLSKGTKRDIIIDHENYKRH